VAIHVLLSTPKILSFSLEYLITELPLETLHRQQEGYCMCWVRAESCKRGLLWDSKVQNAMKTVQSIIARSLNTYTWCSTRIRTTRKNRRYLSSYQR
ncbi:MAG: hypothetical protein QXO87_05825, partial [Desulfurococcaceae archaeon]